MNSQIFAYLKRRHLSDTRTVNKLFVSAFIYLNDIKIQNNSIILDMLIRDNDEEYELLQDFLAVINSHQDLISIEDLINLFEFVISPADRIVTGAIYTPQYIRNYIIKTCLDSFSPEDLLDIRIADIACGCGGFLLDIAEYLRKMTGRSFFDIYSRSLYGIDIQKYSTERTKILLSIFALINGEDIDFEFQVLQADTLDFHSPEWNSKYSNFDIIVGNPPYVCSRNVDESTKKKMLCYEVCHSGHPDLYIPFFQIATEMLNENGRLGFITMNSFIRSVNGRATRNYFAKNKSSIYLIDFRGHQVFKKKNTYTCLFFLLKNHLSDSLFYAVNNTGNLDEVIEYAQIRYDLLDNKKGWSLNDFEGVRIIESSGTPIGEYCQSRHGIATLCNKIFIFKPDAEDNEYYYRYLDGDCIAIEKSICRNVINSNKLNSDVLFESIIEKLIFPYTINNGQASVIDERTMKSQYPKTYTYLKSKRELLNRRDKGKTNTYPEWYAYGRTQSLIMPKYKLFFPKFANKPLHCVINDDSDLMLYNGMAFVSDDLEKINVLKRVLDSYDFWDYIVKNAKPYACGYYSLSGGDIKNYCISD